MSVAVKCMVLHGSEVGVFTATSFFKISSGELLESSLSSYTHGGGQSVGVNVLLYSMNKHWKHNTYNNGEGKPHSSSSKTLVLYVGRESWEFLQSDVGLGGRRPQVLGLFLVAQWLRGFHTARCPRCDLFFGFDTSLVPSCSSRLMLLVDAWCVKGSRPWR